MNPRVSICLDDLAAGLAGRLSSHCTSVFIVAAGELPAAAAARDQLFIAYIVSEGEKRSIWLVTARKNLASY